MYLVEDAEGGESELVSDFDTDLLFDLGRAVVEESGHRFAAVEEPPSTAGEGGGCVVRMESRMGSPDVTRSSVWVPESAWTIVPLSEHSVDNCVRRW